ncbi:MAG: hypothetical protein HY928_09290 [Elusimicrobia bacterium]|nr:hypothetical protein [Elusimicrobiota bacterium]
MKKLLALVIFVAAAAGAGFLALNGNIPGIELGGDQRLLRQKSLRFMECLKFKEFREAAAFHHALDLKERPDIPKMLEDFFLIPPENLDVREVRVDFVELDSTKTRAKVKVTSTVNILNKKETRDPEAMLYWKRVEGQWYLDLRTTLERGRNPL